MSGQQPLYRIQFMNNGKNYQLYVREIVQSNLFGFIEIADFVFDTQSAVLVDPSEEKLKSEFSGVSRSFIPVQAVIRIDAVTERGSARISDLGDNVTTFPYLPRQETMSKPPLIFVVIVAVIVVFAAQRFMQQRRQNAINDAAPINTQQVEVSAKREFPAPNRRSRQREAIAGEDMRYEVYFKPLIGGSELKFIVPETTYHQIDKGAVGKLSTQGTRFVGFEADVK